MLPWLEIEPLKSAFQLSSLWGRSPPVDLKALQECLEVAFEAHFDVFEISWHACTQQEARERQPVDAGHFAFTLNPLQGMGEIFIPTYQLECLSRHFFGGSTPVAQSLEQAFINYWMSMAISQTCSMAPLDFLQPVLAQKTTRVSSAKVLQGMLCIKSADFEISAQILLDETFQQSWISYWSKKPYLGIDFTDSRTIDLDLQLSVGHIELSSQELMSLEVGDWVSLEGIGVKDSLVGSRIDLTLDEKRVASAKLGERSLSIGSIDDFFDSLSIK